MFKTLKAARQIVTSVVADYDSTRRYRGKYHNEQIPMSRLPVDLVRKVGLQMLASIRVMQGLEAARLPLLPQVVSRLIRHAYGAEIHWRAAIEPGVSIVHGVGLVISHRARVEPGCILFQNVTLGEGIDPVTRVTGAPHLGRDVHVGPGATLIGPIHIGEGSKIMAGAVVTRSVPAGSVVKPADITVVERAKKQN
jgi:serine O-acetyltransferase